MVNFPHTVISFPTLRYGIPDAGWLKLGFAGRDATLEFVTSCTPEDSLVTLVVWLEMLLLGEVPAHWYVNGEELGMYIHAAPLTARTVRLTIYKPIRITEPFIGSSTDPAQIWWRGPVEIRPFVAAWAADLRQALTTNFGQAAAWHLDVAQLDFSRIDMLLAGAAVDPVWLAAYDPPTKRVQQLSQPL